MTVIAILNGLKSKGADRFIDIWPSITNSIKFWEKLSKSKQLKCKSYKIVCDAVDDQFTCAMLCFFSFVFKILEPYLVAYKTDKPMLPFFYQDLFVLIRKIMEIIVKPKVLCDCNAAINLKRIDLNKSSNLLNGKDINIGFGTTKMLLDLRKKKI